MGCFEEGQPLSGASDLGAKSLQISLKFARGIAGVHIIVPVVKRFTVEEIKCECAGRCG